MTRIIGNLTWTLIFPVPLRFQSMQVVHPLHMDEGRVGKNWVIILGAQVWAFSCRDGEVSYQWYISSCSLVYFPTFFLCLRFLFMKKRIKKVISLLHLKFFSPICPNNHCISLASPMIFLARFSVLDFPLMHGACANCLESFLASPGSGVLTFLSLPPGVKLLAPHLCPWLNEAEAQCEGQMPEVSQWPSSEALSGLRQLPSSTTCAEPVRSFLLLGSLPWPCLASSVLAIWYWQSNSWFWSQSCKRKLFSETFLQYIQ